MAGSIRSFSYEADDGTKYAVSIDESNGKCYSWSPSNANQPLFNPATVPYPGRIIAGFTMRWVSGVAAYQNIGKRKQFWVGSKAAFENLRKPYAFVYDPSENQWYEIVRLHNEKYPTKPLSDVDSGLTDGSPSQNPG